MTKEMSLKEKIHREHHAKFLWTRFGMVVLGIWLLFSPESFGYVHQPSRYSDWISGLLLLLFGFMSMSYRLRYWIWGGAIVGIWLQFAPLIYWAREPANYVNNTLIGVLAIAFCVLVPLRPAALDLGPEIPPGWTYNPSSWHQRIPIIFLAIVNWFLARYLAAYQLGYIDSVWDPFFGLGTEKVITSMISQRFPVSDAGMGALAYSLEAIMGAKGTTRRWHTMPWLVVVFGFLVVPVGFVSIILVMLQPLAVGAWCGICLIIAASMLIMLALTVDEVVAVLQYLGRIKREGKPLWKVFWLGSDYTEKGIDIRTPTFQVSPWRVVKAMFWGITLPWTLVATALIGVWMMFSGEIFGLSGIMHKSNDVCGALLVTFSVIAWAEVTRSFRFANIFIGVCFAIIPFILGGGNGFAKMHGIVIGLLVVLLSIPRGRVKEQYGSWDKMIR